MPLDSIVGFLHRVRTEAGAQMFVSTLRARALGVLVGLGALCVAFDGNAATGKCDESPGEYTAWTGTNAQLDNPATSTALTGMSEARCLRRIRTLSNVVEGVFRDSQGRYAHELPSLGKLVNMWPGENYNTICNGEFSKPQRNTPGVYCASDWNKTFGQAATYGNALDWKYVNPVRYDPANRVTCPIKFPAMGCFGGRCYDPECVRADGTLKTCGAGEICKTGACVAGDPGTLAACTTVDPQGKGISDGNANFYNPWDAMVYDMGGLANKVAIFAVNDHGPQPCESNEYTVYLTNNPASREIIDDPIKTGADPMKWNRARLHKLYTHGWIDNPSCCDDPKTCASPACTLPMAGDAPNLEADSMVLVFTLPCGIAFRYSSFIAGYDGKGMGEPSAGADNCTFHSFDAEIDAVAGLNDDESAICPDKDGDGFPTCDCSPKPVPCDCVDDPALNPDAKKYYPGAPQACDGPQYSCAPTPCPSGTVCYQKQCLDPCKVGEFKCPVGLECRNVTPTGGDNGTPTNLCIPAACGDAGVCDPGEVCKDGKCIDLCAPPTKCPVGQVCQGGKCLDPCALTKCPVGQLCLSGKCVDNCSCLAPTADAYPCKGATPTCDKMKGTCVGAGCDSTSCTNGQICVATEAGPTCKGKCDDVVCPGKQVCDPVKGCVDKCELLTTPCASSQVCKDGVCIDAECANVSCSAPFVCAKGRCIDPTAGEICLSCDTGAPIPTTDTGAPIGNVDAGVGNDASTGGTFEEPAAEEKSSCQCSTPGNGATKTAATLAAAAFTLAFFARRRRR